MKKLFRMISVYLAAALLMCTAVGCSYSAPSQTLPKLATPEVVIDDYGVASWDSVDYAGYYVYVIDEGEEHATLELHAQLEYNESIKVKAVSVSEQFADSAFSSYKACTVKLPVEDNPGDDDNNGDGEDNKGDNNGDNDGDGEDNKGDNNGDNNGEGEDNKGDNDPVVGPELPAEVKAYYSNITATKGNTLLGQVHDLITKTHTYYTTYGECSQSKYVDVTDPGPKGGALEFYTQKSIMSFSGNIGDWNREHVWCKSLSNGMWKSVSNSTRNGGSDMHHIRPSECGLNSTRGSKKFGEVNGGTAAWSRNSSKNNVAIGGYYSGSTFEPLDNVKGDVARIVLYVYTHYNTYANVYGSTNGNQSGVFGTLNFTNIMAANSENSAIQMLIKWSADDPVDEIEITRNNEVYKIQGNRNPFIDHPEYVNAIWG